MKNTAKFTYGRNLFDTYWPEYIIRELFALCGTLKWYPIWSISLTIISKWKSFSCVWLFATPWVIQSVEFSRLSLLQGIFPTQELNPSLLRCRWILYQLNLKGNPRVLEWVAHPFCSGSFWPRNQTGVSCIAGGFFTNWAIREALT